jgi:hypothetical protein
MISGFDCLGNFGISSIAIETHMIRLLPFHRIYDLLTTGRISSLWKWVIPSKEVLFRSKISTSSHSAFSLQTESRTLHAVLSASEALDHKNERTNKRLSHKANKTSVCFSQLDLG